MEKAALACGLAKEKGLKLLPCMDEEILVQETVNSETTGLFGDEDTIGKGAFDGW